MIQTDNIKPKIIQIKEKYLLGMQMRMSLAENKTAELWSKFIPRHHEIKHKLSNDFISLQIYNPNYFLNFKPTNQFEKWACLEVISIENIPNEMQTLILKAGLYAVFDYKGLSTDFSIFQYIYGTWIPNSNYNLDNRPHFEILGDKYKNNDPSSEEEIWIPIIQK